MKTTKLWVGTSLAMLALGVIPLNAATVTWGGSSGDYLTGANWVGGSVPNTAGGDTAIINAGAVNYVAGGDLSINNGGVLQISGGSFVQTGGVSWIQLGGGTLLINGGTFTQGTAGNLNRNATSAIQVTAGIANLNGNLVYETAATGAFSLSGTGVVNVANEFKPIDTFTLSGGTLNAGNLVSFADGPGSIIFTGGKLSVDGSGGNSGFYGGGAKGLNFLTGSSGVLVFNTYTLAELATDNFLNNGTIQFNGVANASQFTAVQNGGNVEVFLTAVPEPSTYALLGAGLISLVALRRRKNNA